MARKTAAERLAEIAELRALLGDDDALEAQIASEPKPLAAPPRGPFDAHPPGNPHYERHLSAKEWTCSECGVRAYGPRVKPLERMGICGGCCATVIEMAREAFQKVSDAAERCPGLLTLAPELQNLSVPHCFAPEKKSEKDSP